MKNFCLPTSTAGVWLLLLMLLNAPVAWANVKKDGTPKITFAPSLKANPSSLNVPTTQVGSFSSGVLYTLSWENIPEGQEIRIAAEDGFKVRGNFSPEIATTLSAAFVQQNTHTEIAVFMADDRRPGNYNGVITNFVGAVEVKVAVNGTITPIPGSISVIGAPLTVPQSTEGDLGESARFTLKVKDLLDIVPRKIEAIAPEFFEISLTENGLFSNNLDIPFPSSSGILVNGDIPVFARLKNNLAPGTYKTEILFSNPQFTPISAGVNGTVFPTKASLTTSPSNLSGFKASGQHPSVEQSYLLLASGFPSQVVSQFTIVAPESFQISTERDGTYLESLIIGTDKDDQDGLNDFSSLSQPIFVRLRQSESVGIHSGEILNISSLVGTKRVNVTGESFSQIPAELSSGAQLITGLTTAQGSVSATKNYLLVLKNSGDFEGTATTVTPPAGFEVSKSKDGPFSDNLVIDFNEWATDPSRTKTSPVFVRIKANAPEGPLSGNMLNDFGSIANLSIPIDGTVTPGPQTTVNPTTMTFSTIKGTPSAAKSFSLSGINMPKSNPAQVGVTVIAPAGYEASTFETGPYSDQFNTLAVVGDDFTASRTLFVRLKGISTGTVNGTLSVQMANAVPSTIALNGTVTGPAPILTFNPTSLTGFVSNGTDPSATQSYTLTAANFPTGDLNEETGITITAPAAFEFSFNNLDFSNSINISADGSHTFQVRLKAGLSAGNYSGSIQHANKAIVTVNLFVSGSVVPEPVLISEPEILENFEAEIGKAGRVKSYKVKARNFPTIPSEQTLVVDAPNRFEVSKTETGVFEDKIQFTLSNGSLDATVFVRLRDNAPEGVSSGNIVQRIGTLAETIVIVSGRVVQVFPVTLASFEGKALPSGKAFLEWKTTQETNNAGFEVQKSGDAKVFENIAWIEGNGTFNGLNVYDFTDETLPTTTYYRLKQIDYDGTYSFSRIVVVVPEHESLARLNAWPNPSPGGVFNVQYPEHTNQTGLFDLTGKPILNWNKGDKIDLSTYPSGLYFLKIQTKEGTRSLKLMKP
jgi:hypothetical protein